MLVCIPTYNDTQKHTGTRIYTYLTSVTYEVRQVVVTRHAATYAHLIRQNSS